MGLEGEESDTRGKGKQMEVGGKDEDWRGLVRGERALSMHWAVLWPCHGHLLTQQCSWNEAGQLVGGREASLGMLL